MARDAKFRIIGETPSAIVLEDLGPWDQHLTITNDAEGVVQRVAPILAGRRLFYRDSEGDVDELLVRADGRFGGFAPGGATAAALMAAVR